MKMLPTLGLSTDVVKFAVCDDTPIHDDVVNEVLIIIFPL